MIVKFPFALGVALKRQREKEGKKKKKTLFQKNCANLIKTCYSKILECKSVSAGICKSENEDFMQQPKIERVNWMHDNEY